MPARLSPEKPVKIEVRLPAKLKKQAVKIAKDAGDGDVSHWVRRQIHNAWRAAEGK